MLWEVTVLPGAPENQMQIYHRSHGYCNPAWISTLPKLAIAYK
jgi:hypothetical protein